MSFSRASSIISSRFLIRQVNQVETIANECDEKSMRPALRVFLTLREVYRRLYRTTIDHFYRVVITRHTKTEELHQCFQRGTPIKMVMLVSLSCLSNMGVSAAVIISPEPIILAQVSSETISNYVRFFSPCIRQSAWERNRTIALCFSAILLFVRSAWTV